MNIWQARCICKHRQMVARPANADLFVDSSLHGFGDRQTVVFTEKPSSLSAQTRSGSAGDAEPETESDESALVPIVFDFNIDIHFADADSADLLARQLDTLEKFFADVDTFAAVSPAAGNLRFQGWVDLV